MTLTSLTYEDTLRELPTDEGVLRYHEAGDGPPLLLLHGSGPGVTGWRNYRGNLPVFAQHFRTLALEFPGFGVSDPTDENPMAAAPKAVLRFLEGLGLDRDGVDVIGNSMGGFVAVGLAVARKDLFRRVVTIGGVGRNILSPALSEGLGLLVEFTENPTRDNLVQWLRSMVFDPSLLTDDLIEERWVSATDPATLEASRRIYGRQAMAGTVAAQARSDQPIWAALHKVTAPTLLTWGRDDRVTPLDNALLPMRTIPKAELHVLPDCGHWAMIEQKAAWESAVLAFLTRPETS
ncbi:alpha/beta fold hydrolase [Streptomyces sp. WI04-05B]|uniref:alpha/beta fold hydrolase n=1 Tax=Streptomyces TaxID=1883 RepID=UPI0029B472D1|nr:MULTISPECIES: alpha/beta fold hydrolase [unclassified Streptomyces]MDX2545055.1 alpha/beta fold hydrolase [Streptomyces sp. WI04-05B]MDX2587546.1 alpha/beta fold hydrolase [Streptomyces sp. WI04-05A]